MFVMQAYEQHTHGIKIIYIYTYTHVLYIMGRDTFLFKLYKAFAL